MTPVKIQVENEHFRALMQLLVGVEQKHPPEMIEQYARDARKIARRVSALTEGLTKTLVKTLEPSIRPRGGPPAPVPEDFEAL